jgi:hypothetical protein
MSRRLDLTNETFGRWTVIGRGPDKHWLCRCACGAEKPVFIGSLRSGRSAGCMACAAQRGNARTHGGRGSRLYKIWEAMKRRCGSPACGHYARYGGRGIRVCAEWAESFDAFRAWAMANGYADHLTIERRNNDGHYEPSNCTWATQKEQARNQSTNRHVTYHGRLLTVGALAEEVGLPATALKQRLFKHGWPLERAVSEPLTVRARPAKLKALTDSMDARVAEIEAAP